MKLFDFNHDGEVILADEISPDTCRLWDVCLLYTSDAADDKSKTFWIIEGKA